MVAEPPGRGPGDESRLDADEIARLAQGQNRSLDPGEAARVARQLWGIATSGVGLDGDELGRRLVAEHPELDASLATNVAAALVAYCEERGIRP